MWIYMHGAHGGLLKAKPLCAHTHARARAHRERERERERERWMGLLDHRSAGPSEVGQDNRRTDGHYVGAHASQWPMDR
jgi:hypothetical protein